MEENEELGPETAEDSEQVDPEIQEEPKYKVVVDGREVELTLEELRSGYQQSAASQKRFKEAAELEKRSTQRESQVSQLLDGLTKGQAFALLEQLGVDVDSLAEDRVAKKYELQMMSPEQRRLLEIEKELGDYKSKEQKQLEQQEDTRRADLRNQNATRIEKMLEAEWTRSGGIVDPKVWALGAEELHSDIQNGKEISQGTVASALKRGQERATKMYGHFLTALPFEEALKLLPDDFQKKWKQEQTKKATSGKPFSLTPTTASGAGNKGEKKPVGTDEFLKQLEQKFK